MVGSFLKLNLYSWSEMDSVFFAGGRVTNNMLVFCAGWQWRSTSN